MTVQIQTALNQILTMNFHIFLSLVLVVAVLDFGALAYPTIKSGIYFLWPRCSSIILKQLISEITKCYDFECPVGTYYCKKHTKVSIFNEKYLDIHVSCLDLSRNNLQLLVIITWLLLIFTYLHRYGIKNLSRPTT